MESGYARVSTDGQSVAAQVAALTAAGAAKVFRGTASGAKIERAQPRKALAALEAGDVLMVTRLDRLARSTRDLLNTLAAITGRERVSASFATPGRTGCPVATEPQPMKTKVCKSDRSVRRECVKYGYAPVDALRNQFWPFPFARLGKTFDTGDWLTRARRSASPGGSNNRAISCRQGWRVDARVGRCVTGFYQRLCSSIAAIVIYASSKRGRHLHCMP